VIIFGSVRFLSKKVTKPNFFLKKNRNQVKPTGFGSVRFFRAKTGSNRFGSVFSVLTRFFPVLARFFSVWLGFFGLARFWLGFFVLARFFRFGSVFFPVSFGSVRFFRFFVYKTETEPAGFFKKLIGLIGFFFGSVFSVIFFLVFSV